MERVETLRSESIKDSHAVVIWHQHAKKKHRLSVSVEKIFQQSGVTIATAKEFQCVIDGFLDYGWSRDLILQVLFTPGRQFDTPPDHHPIGVCRTFFAKLAVVSVSLDEEAMIKRGDKVCYQTPFGYLEETVASMQIDGENVDDAQGPCRVGLSTTLEKKAVSIGKPVFMRRVST